MFSAKKELEDQRLAKEEQVFVKKFGSQLLASQLPEGLTEDRFQLILGAAVRDLPACSLKTALLQHIHQHAATLWAAYSERSEVLASTAGKKRKQGPREASGGRQQKRAKRASPALLRDLAADPPLVYSEASLAEQIALLELINDEEAEPAKFHQHYEQLAASPLAPAYAIAEYFRLVGGMVQKTDLKMADVLARVRAASRLAAVVEGEEEQLACLEAAANTTTQALELLSGPLSAPLPTEETGDFGALLEAMLGVAALCGSTVHETGSTPEAAAFVAALVSLVVHCSALETTVDRTYAAVLALTGTQEVELLVDALSQVECSGDRLGGELLFALCSHAVRRAALDRVKLRPGQIARLARGCKRACHGADKSKKRKLLAQMRRRKPDNLLAETACSVAGMPRVVDASGVFAYLVNDASYTQLAALINELEREEEEETQAGDGEEEQPAFFVDVRGSGKAKTAEEERMDTLIDECRDGAGSNAEEESDSSQ